MKVLLEMRPAMDGHSGIPQETRLLFRGLSRLDGIEVLGLLQSGNLLVEPGLPLRKGQAPDGVTSTADLDRLSRVVVSLLQGPAAHRFEQLRRKWWKLIGPLGAAVGSLVGLRVALTGFDPKHFRDFVWRTMFAKSLPIEDFEAVTSAQFRVLRWPWSFANAIGVVSGALGHAAYPRLDTDGVDVMLVETPYPGRVSGATRMVVRYHDAMPLLMPHTVKARGYHRSMHFRALVRNAADGAWFACVSDASRRDLLSVMPELAPRAVTIPNMISHHFKPETEPADRVPEIIWSRKNRQAPCEGGAAIDPTDLRDGKLSYLLMVATVEPRKNHPALLDAWELLRSRGHRDLNLVCVGNLGWDHEALLRRFEPWLARGGLHLLADVPAEDLRLLYRHAQATVCPSFGEGFDFPGVEAMRSGGVVAASDIPVHRDVFGGAAVYFSPYAPAEAADAIEPLIESNSGASSVAKRAELVAEGERVALQYLPDRVLPQWQAFLRRVVA